MTTAGEQHEHDHHRPGDAGAERNGGERIDERQDGADGEIDAAGRDDEGHRHRDDHERRDLAHDVEEIRLASETCR